MSVDANGNKRQKTNYAGLRFDVSPGTPQSNFRKPRAAVVFVGYASTTTTETDRDRLKTPLGKPFYPLPLSETVMGSSTDIHGYQMQGTVAIVLSLVLGLVGRFLLTKTTDDPVKSRNICVAVVSAKLIASGFFSE